ncbi:hypothetical protein AQUCO_00700504v1 [Aquilegia coerulea]|uniref:Uncharacterized protein n=1 Tax=Aquilegia coerulea TaxID=218851 RepID=A0A2G5EKE2_AQUCA|nr:hypothetical protein AQUCO_00700504v1 [Aquilegia coerulea]
MAETKKKNKKKKVTISEEDMTLLLKRYSATVIVKLLQEVAQVPDVKFDWNEVVKKTSTGITSAREYQMLWRHLAYRDTLLENVDERMEPLDDDSDLETDLESFPPVSAEASGEAAAFAKVLIGSRLPSNPGPPNRPTVEGPLTINIPIGQSSPVASDNPQPADTIDKNIIVPVVVPKEKDGGGPKACPAKGKKREDEDKDPNGATGTNKRKRKQWTEQEDMELIAAVRKCGERNWSNILKGEFKGDRTASQLSQRWAILRKKQAHLGGAGPNSQLTEAQLATRRAVSHALNMPMVDNLMAACSVGATQSSIPSSSAEVPCGPEDMAGAQTQQASRNKGISTPTSKPKGTAAKGPTVPFKSHSGSDPMIQAAAVAAGARIATPSTAASLLKAAQSKNVVHFRPGGCSMIKTSLPGATKPSPTNHVGSRPKVHYIRTGLAPASAPPTYSSPGPSIPHPGGSQQEHGNSTKRQIVTGSLPLSTASSIVVLPSSSSTALCGAEETKMAEDTKSEEIKEDGSGSASKEFDDGQVDPKSGTFTENHATTVENLKSETFTENHATTVENLKSETFTENHATTVGNLKQLTIVDAGENKQLDDASKQAESSDAVKTEACTTAMDED